MARPAPEDMSPLQRAIADALAAAPEKRDFYDRKIREKNGTTGKPIYDIERGKSKNPSLDTLRAIADVLGLPANHFIGGDVPPDSTARPFQMEGASLARMKPDVPIFGTALGADKIVDGEAIEQTTLNTGEVVGHMRRPVLLDGRADVYGVYIQGSSMAPRHKDGEKAFVERKPPRIGDDVVVYLKMPDEIEGERVSSVLIKELVRRTASYIELRQYGPALDFKIEASRVDRIDRVIPWSELVD